MLVFNTDTIYVYISWQKRKRGETQTSMLGRRGIYGTNTTLGFMTVRIIWMQRRSLRRLMEGADGPTLHARAVDGLDSVHRIRRRLRRTDGRPATTEQCCTLVN